MVKAWKEKVVIPTYEVGKPEKNPIFLEQQCQGHKSHDSVPWPLQYYFRQSRGFRL